MITATAFWAENKNVPFVGFLDTFSANAAMCYSMNRLTGNSSKIAMEIGLSGGGINVFWNEDGTLTGDSLTDSDSYPTLQDCIDADQNNLFILYEQMSGGDDFIIYNTNSAVKITLNTIGYAQIISLGTSPTVLCFVTNDSYIVPQPLSLFYRVQFESDSNFKTFWRFDDGDGVLQGLHNSIRFESGGALNLGTSRNTANNMTLAADQYLLVGDGVDGDLYINNVAKGYAGLGNNGTANVIRFGARSMLEFTEIILFTNALDSTERTELKNQIDTIYS